MALPANNQNGTFQGPTTHKQSKLTWAQALRGHSTQLSTSSLDHPPIRPNTNDGDVGGRADSVPPEDHFRTQVIRPYLKGSFPHSVFIDITNVSNDQQKTFITEFSKFCDDDKHLFAISNKIRQDYARRYAEVKVSPLMYQKLVTNPEFMLASFYEPFHAYPSLSSSDKIIKVSFTNLPAEYGRAEGGLQQLRDDMSSNLSQYGNILDCGLVKGSTGVYAGGGYAVLIVQSEHTQALSHSLDWAYHPLDYSITSSCALSKESDSVNVLATWASMPPYCRYCHSEQHAILDCEKRKNATLCHLCHAAGHIAKHCPRKNVSLSKKQRKTPSSVPSAPSSAPVDLTTDESPSADHHGDSDSSMEATLPTDSSSVPSAPVPSSITDTTIRNNLDSPSPIEPDHHTRSQGMVTRRMLAGDKAPPRISSVVVCKHCKLPGHSRTTSKQCLHYGKKTTNSATSSSLSTVHNHSTSSSDAIPDDDIIMDEPATAPHTSTSISSPQENLDIGPSSVSHQ